MERRLEKERQALFEDPPVGVSLEEASSLQWKAVGVFPDGSSFEGREFRLEFQIPSGFPFVPPQVHLSMWFQADCAIPLCAGTLASMWSPSMLLCKLVMTIVACFHDPQLCLEIAIRSALSAIRSALSESVATGNAMRPKPQLNGKGSLFHFPCSNLVAQPLRNEICIALKAALRTVSSQGKVEEAVETLGNLLHESLALPNKEMSGLRDCVLNGIACSNRDDAQLPEIMSCLFKPYIQEPCVQDRLNAALDHFNALAETPAQSAVLRAAVRRLRDALMEQSNTLTAESQAEWKRRLQAVKAQVFDIEEKMQSDTLCSKASVVWEYKRGSDWACFSVSASKELEDWHCGLISNPQGCDGSEQEGCGSIIVDVGATQYSVDLHRMLQTNTRTGRQRCVRRTQKPPREHLLSQHLRSHGVLQNPLGVDHALLLDVTSRRKSEIQSLLQRCVHTGTPGFACSRCKGMCSAEVVQVLQIHNEGRWKRYAAALEKLRAEHQQHHIELQALKPAVPSKLAALTATDASLNEVMLLHGTEDEKALAIANFGFNEQMSGDKCCYGCGIYFTPSSCKALKYTKPDVHEGLRSLIVSRVAIGDPYYAEQPMVKARHPPERKGPFQEGLLFDAVVANPGVNRGPGKKQRHQEVIIFDGNRAYPELLVRFRVPYGLVAFPTCGGRKPKTSTLQHAIFGRRFPFAARLRDLGRYHSQE